MKKSQKKALAIGAGLTAAAAAAGAYFLAGKRGAKNRAAIKQWAKSAEADLGKRLKGVKSVTKKSYDDAVKTVLAEYKKVKKMSPAELASLGTELKHKWQDVTRTTKKVTQKPTRKPAAKKRR